MNRTAGRPAGAGGDYADEFITKIGSRRTVLAGSTLVLLFLLLLWWQIGRWYESQVVAETRVNLAVDVGLRGNALAALLNRRFARLQALTAFVETLPAETDVEENFAAFAARLYDETQGVRSFSLAPGGEVRFVYPLAGNEALLGERPLDDPRPEFRDAAQRALRSGRIVVAGPLALPDGDPGLVARQAVYREGSFWGLTGLALDLESLLADAGLLDEQTLAFALRDESGHVFFGDEALFDGDPVINLVPLQEESWELAAAPREGWAALATTPTVLPFRLTSLVVVLLLTGLTYVTLGRQATLSDEVLARTRELALANARLEERVTSRTRELATLLEVARSFTATLSLQPLVDLILARLKQEPGYTMAALYIVGGSQNGGQAGLSLLRADGSEAPPASWHPLGLVLKERQPLRRTGGDGHAAWLIVPLQVSERVIGVLALAHQQVNRYDEHDAALVLAVASYAAVALDNARLYEQAQNVAVLQERQRLARELHDSVSQALYGIALGTRTARQWLERQDESQAAAALDYVQPLTEAALTEMRALIFELRPESLAREGLSAALERQAEVMQSRHRIQVTVELCPEPDARLPVKEALYRVAQEALNNVVRHAGASHVWLRMQCANDRLGLEIRDNGRGFDPTRDYPGHLGLHSMRERIENLGGTFRLESAPGEGTRIQAVVPLEPGREAPYQTRGSSR